MDKVSQHSRRAMTTGRPPPADFACRKFAAVSKKALQGIYGASYETIERWWHDPEVLREEAELAAEAVLRIGKVGEEEAALEVAQGSIEEQARMVLGTAAEILRAQGDVETAARVEAVRDRILPDSVMNVVIDVEVDDE